MTPAEARQKMLSEGYSADEVDKAIGALAPSAKPSHVPDTVEGVARGLKEAMTLGWGDEGAGAIAATLPFLDPEAAQGETWGERYGAARDFYRNRDTLARKEYPSAFLAGEVAGGLVPAAKIIGASRGLGMLGRSGALGAIAGAGAADEQGLGGRAFGGAVGGTLGVVGGAAGILASKALAPVGRFVGSRIAEDLPGATLGAAKAGTPAASVVPDEAGRNALYRALASKITPTPEAAYLQSRGVPLTVGQLNPRSPVGQIEEAATSLRYTGPAISAQRGAAQREWQRSVLSEALPPGMEKLPQGTNINELLDAVYQGFKPAYEAVKGEAIYPAIHMAGKGIPLQSKGASAGAFELAAKDPSVLAPADVRSMVGAFLNNQLSLLPNVAKTTQHGMHGVTTFERPAMVGQVSVEDVLTMRSNIRDAIRSAVQQRNYPAAQLLGNAEKAVTQAVESQVSPETATAMRAVDKQYRVYKTLEDVVSRAGDSPSGFTSGQLTQAIKAATDRGDFARGGGGALRELSKAGRAVFESVSPPTGARYLTVGPWGEWATGPAVMLANRPAQSTDRLMQQLASSPRMSAYADLFRRTLTAAGPSGAAALHFELWDKDPTYRQQMQNADKPGGE